MTTDANLERDVLAKVKWNRRSVSSESSADNEVAAVRDVSAAGGPVVVATCGDPSSDAAIRVGGMFAFRTRRLLDVVAVLRPALTPGIAYVRYVEAVHDAAAKATAARVRRQVEDSVPGVVARVRVETGAPAEGITAHAEAVAASLIVVGIGEHTTVDRLLGLETAIGVIHYAHTPVLAVAPDAQVRTTVVALATDFEPAATQAAHVALELASDDARVHVLHVGPATDALRSRLAAWADALSVSAPRLLTVHLLEGDPVHALSAFCEAHGVELIALGTHGKGFVERLRLGSVADGVLRRAGCSVLVAPPNR